MNGSGEVPSGSRYRGSSINGGAGGDDVVAVTDGSDGDHRWGFVDGSDPRDPGPGADRVPGGRRLRPRSWSVRQRVLALILAVMTAGLAVTGAVSYGIGYRSVSERVDRELEQELDELRLLAQSGPQQDGQPYTDLAELVLAFLNRSVAGENEAMMGLVEGQPPVISGGDRAFDVADPEVLNAVRELDVPEGRALFHTLRTPDTTLRLLVSDLQLPDDPRSAEFVVANDIGRQHAQVRSESVTYAILALLVLAAVTGLSHLLLGRLLRPLTDLREATAVITTDDLSRRVEVEAGDTDVAELAIRFNSMLDRIEAGVNEQRQFLDDAAHELRTPLTIVRGNAELLRAEDPADVASARALIMDEVDRMQRLVDDLLMLARSQRPDFYRPAPTDVTELALEAMERITSLGRRAWRLHAEAEGTAELDRHRIIQAVVQLAANAVKFSDAGSVVELATSWASPLSDEGLRARELGARPAARYLVLSLCDEGIGIPADQQERVFDRFGRADNTGHTEGSGLGLPIVKAIAEAHGGAVGVESEEGKGSTFTLWLPNA